MHDAAINAVTSRLESHVQGCEPASPLINLWDFIGALKHRRAPSSADDVWTSLLQDFEELNTLLNSGAEFSLGRTLAYAINELLTICLDVAASDANDPQTRKTSLHLAWLISTAWDAVLAGDIENIEEHVELEFVARGM